MDLVMQSTVRQWTRIPVSVGMAPTKTHCKVANYFAKRQPEHRGILLLDSPARIAEVLHEFPISELWGVGSRYAAMLRRHDIRNAAQLRDTPDDWINQTMTVNGLRLAYELRGCPASSWKRKLPPKRRSVPVPVSGD